MLYKLSILLLAVLCCFQLVGQNRNPFKSYLPIMDNTSFSWRSPMNKNEALVFDAQPTLYYQFFNTYLNQEKRNKHAIYAIFKTHIRMFQGESFPIKTPSYKGFFGYQHSFKWGNNHFNLALETGHYSNGQSGCAWAENIKDGTDECKVARAAISDQDDLAKLLNRSSGNFATNLTRFSIQYVIPKIKESATKDLELAHRFTLGYSKNHKAFAFPFNFSSGKGDIQIIGNQTISLSSESFFSLNENFDLSIKNKLDYIDDVHPSINPWRYNFTVNFFPKEWVTAFFMAFTSGHDNYNYRIVDSGNQFSVGVRWDLFDRSQYQ